jgi:hypothetical protein
MITSNTLEVAGFVLDGNSGSVTGCRLITSNAILVFCLVKNFNTASTPSGGFYFCVFTGFSATACVSSAVACEAYGNSATPYAIVSNQSLTDCLSYGNTGVATDGFSAAGGNISNCVAYGNGRDGFRAAGSSVAVLRNCHAENNTGVGFTVSNSGKVLDHCSAYNNTGGATSLSGPVTSLGFISVTAGSVFNNAAGNDFSLNNTAGQGALLRAAGAPSLFPAGVTASYRDIGAAQHQDPAGGGGMIQSRVFAGF